MKNLAVHLSMILSLRVGEILGLQPGDIDFDAADGRGTITVGRSLQLSLIHIFFEEAENILEAILRNILAQSLSFRETLLGHLRMSIPLIIIPLV